MKSLIYWCLIITAASLFSSASQQKDYSVPVYMHPFAHLIVKSVMYEKNKKTNPKSYKALKSHAPK